MPALRPPPSMLFMKAKKDPTYTGVKSTVSAATCNATAVFTARTCACCLQTEREERRGLAVKPCLAEHKAC